MPLALPPSRQTITLTSCWNVRRCCRYAVRSNVGVRQRRTSLDDPIGADRLGFTNVRILIASDFKTVRPGPIPFEASAVLSHISIHLDTSLLRRHC